MIDVEVVSVSGCEQLGISILVATLGSAETHASRLEAEFRALESKSIGLATIASVVAAIVAWSIAIHGLPIALKVILGISLIATSLALCFCYWVIKSVTLSSPPTPLEFKSVAFPLSADLLNGAAMSRPEIEAGISDLLAMYERSANALTRHSLSRANLLWWQERFTLVAVVAMIVGISWVATNG